MNAMRLIPICLDNQKTRKISTKQIPEMNLSEAKTDNRRSKVRYSHHTCMKLLTRKQKTPTAGTSAERIRLPSIWQQMQKPSPTAGGSTERIRLPGSRQHQSRYEAKYHEQLQLQIQFQLQLRP
jgi:hypothetical protein